MNRDELPHAIGVALVKAREAIPRDEWCEYNGEADDILPVIDAYVQAERERIAQAIEAPDAEDRLIFRVTAANIARSGGESR